MKTKKSISFNELKRLVRESRVSERYERPETKITPDMMPEKLKRIITVDFGGTIYDNPELSQTPYIEVDIPREFQSKEPILRKGQSKTVLNGYKRIAELKNAILSAGWKINGIDSPGQNVDDCYVFSISPKGMSTRDVIDDEDDVEIVAEKRFSNAKKDYLTPDEEAVIDEFESEVKKLSRKYYQELVKLGVEKGLAKYMISDYVEHFAFGLDLK